MYNDLDFIDEIMNLLKGITLLFNFNLISYDRKNFPSKSWNWDNPRTYLPGVFIKINTINAKPGLYFHDT